MKPERPVEQSSSILADSIVKALLYSDIFDYPLTAGEIFQRLSTNHVELADVEVALARLQASAVVYQKDNFFSLRNESQLFHRRLEGNALAKQMMPKARQRARLISQFPFVRAVLISGSLSKDFANKESDVDFFIVTKEGRLWTTRMLLVIYQKIVLLNSRKYFCLNYFVDERHLVIEEQNTFSATELATLIPVYGYRTYQRLMEANLWTRNFLPNHRPHASNENNWTDGRLKKAMEYIFSGSLFDGLESAFRRLTFLHWQRRYRKNYPPAQFEVAFKALPHVAKSHPSFFQQKVLDAYHRKIADYFSTQQKAPA